MKRVWILGSGFSKPLGGPLLRDLFRKELRADIEPFFPLQDYGDLARSMPWIQFWFHEGMAEGLWDNAEQFLVYVDDAYRVPENAKRQRLKRLMDLAYPKHEPEWYQRLNDGSDASGSSGEAVFRHELGGDLDRRVTRALAAECERFVKDADPNAEPWQPYRSWVKSLTPTEDTILSFNYDRVVEVVARAELLHDNLWIPASRADHGFKNPDPNKIPFLKLHGSVDWCLEPEDKVSRQGAAQNILKDPVDQIAIAAPGASKSDLVSTAFSQHWKCAEQALQNADQLMIVGYSFPDTDSTPQMRLLEAFSSQVQETEARWIHIVMGAEETSASRRMVSLARSTAGPKDCVAYANHASAWVRHGSSNGILHVVLHPLGAQDFIGRYGRFSAKHYTATQNI